MSIKTELEQAVKGIKALDPDHGFAYSCCEEFVLKYGAEYKGQPLPKQFGTGAFKQCYKNSMLMPEQHQELTYVEGYASFTDGIPPHEHAWCVDKHGYVYDRTWGYDENREYYGVRFKLSYVKKILKATGSYSIFNTNDFAVFTDNPSEWLCQQGDNV